MRLASYLQILTISEENRRHSKWNWKRHQGCILQCCTINYAAQRQVQRLISRESCVASMPLTYTRTLEVPSLCALINNLKSRPLDPMNNHSLVLAVPSIHTSKVSSRMACSQEQCYSQQAHTSRLQCASPTRLIPCRHCLSDSRSAYRGLGRRCRSVACSYGRYTNTNTVR